jgi:hypothetical protein
MENPKLTKILLVGALILGISLLLLGVYIDLAVLPNIYGTPTWLYILNILPGTSLIYTSLNFERVRRLRKSS